MTLLHGPKRRLLREIVPLLRIALMIVELLRSVRIAYIAPPFTAHRVISFQVGHQGGALPGQAWIPQKGHHTDSITPRSRQATKFQQGRVDDREVHRPLTTSSGRAFPAPSKGRPDTLGNNHDERNVITLFPECELLDMLFLPEMEPMVGPEHHDGSLAARAGLKGGKNPAHLRICKSTTGRIGLDKPVQGAGQQRGASACGRALR